MNLAVFAYNFPHKKTQDFLWYLLTYGFGPRIVLAQNWIQLGYPEPNIRVKPRHTGLVHPKAICSRFGIAYHVVDHNSEECRVLLRQNDIDIAVISGARILDRATIASVAKGIINIHLGLIPEHRGLDGLKWSILKGHPLGVTAHIVDEHVDAGRLIERKIIEEYTDDSFVDLSIRMHEAQIELLPRAIEGLRANPAESFPIIERGQYYSQMPAEFEAKLPELLAQRLGQLARADR